MGGFKKIVELIKRLLLALAGMLKTLGIKTWESLKKLGRNLDRKMVIPFYKFMAAFFSRRLVRKIEKKDMAEWKIKALEDFRFWLEEMPEQITKQDGTVLESCDLYTLLSEFGSLRQEIKFQNREQGKAIDSLNSLSKNYEQTLRLFGERTMHMDEMEEKIRTSAERRTALPFLDIRDALIRGREAGVEVSEQKGFFVSVPKGIDGIIEGYDMAIRRFDRCLKLIGMEKIETVGKPFDAKTMKAIEKRPDSTVEPGTVVEEQLSGYTRFDEVIRTAEVVVSYKE